jgi:hypothetical protein
MPTRRAIVLRPAAFLAVVLLAAGCGSSTTTSTAPSSITRCSIALKVNEPTVPATGGSGVVSVAATRECAWSASVEGSWISIKSGTSGQGEGTVEFVAGSNPDPQSRSAAVIVNDTRAQITQSAGECVITLADSSADFPPAGGTARVDVRASSQLCTWTVASDSPWVEITSGANGRGSAPVTISVAPTTGPPRAGSLTIGGQRFSVTQSQGCTYSINRNTHNAAANGGSGTVTIKAAAACPWTAASNVEWITVHPPAGSGPGPVTLSVTPTQGPERTGTAVIAGQLFTVTQLPGCAYQVQPTAHSVGASGGTVTVSVSTATGCSWTAGSNASWITVQGSTSGNGPGNVTLSVAATTGPARSGTMTVAGQQVSVTQTQGCAFSISPQSQTVASSGGTGKVTVTTGEGCAWTATSSASWVPITSGSSGSGNGEVQFSVAATTGPGRSATLTIAGQTFTVTQGEGCTYRLSPSSVDIDDDGGQRSFEVQTGPGCGWTAGTTTPWITINSGASGSGNGTVRLTVAANSGPSRNGSITAGGQMFSVNQGTGCAYALSAENHDVPAAGGSGSVNVTAGNGCNWTATSNVSWLTITSGASGSGNGSVGFTAAASTGPARSGTLTIAGRTFTVNQGESCTYSINPTQHGMPGSGGTVDVSVSAPGGCTWTATSNVSWITVIAGPNGNGNGTVRLTVDPNASGSRNGTVTIAGRTFTVEQGSGCDYSISPTSQPVRAAGGNATVNVTAQGSCAWTATSNAPWIVVTSGSTGTGNGAVQMSVEPNTGAPRTGTLTVAGQTITIAQESGCAFTVAPETITSPVEGATARVDVTTSATCAWTATSNAPWITVTAGASGTGSGPVDLSVAANTGPARGGTVSVAGRTVSVSQGSGCTIALTPTAQTVPAAGGAGSVNVAAGAGCTWTVVSAVAWIVVTSGPSGSGDGVVQFTVDTNATGAPRSGTITIGGQTSTVNQQ